MTMAMATETGERRDWGGCHWNWANGNIEWLHLHGSEESTLLCFFFLMCVSVFSTDSVLRLFLKIYMYLQGDDDGEDEVRVDHHRSSDFACLFFFCQTGWLAV
jgi:hypothetical protein